MKYKVGDKVKVRKDLEINYSGRNVYHCVSNMLDYREKILTIESINKFGYLVKENNFGWSDCMFENDREPEFGELVLCEKYGNKIPQKLYFVANLEDSYIVSRFNPVYFKGDSSEIMYTWKKKFVSPIPETVELTMQEIADKFSIDVNNLKIKK